MKLGGSGLPEFDSPPIAEVVLGVQYDVAPSFSAAHLGLFWRNVRERFPRTEHHAPLAPVTERIGPQSEEEPRVQIELVDRPPTPRCWFLDSEGATLLQLQADRFIMNWRRSKTAAAYPRYGALRNQFASDYRLLQSFFAEQELGLLKPRQCEVTYVNHIVAGQGWSGHGDLGRVTPLFVNTSSNGFLNSLEHAQLESRYTIADSGGRPLGRLHVTFVPGFRKADWAPSFTLTLTARGAPLGDGPEAVFEFLDVGHEFVVRGFESVTTPQMHEIWRKRK